MAKFTKSPKVASPSRTRSRVTTNLAGGQAYTQTAELEFASILLTSFLKDKFYETEKETTGRILTLLGQVDPKFAAKSAIYARNEFGMRSVSHLVAGELALRVKGQPWLKNFLQKVVRRPDDVLEILGYVMTKADAIPNSVKKGLGAAMSTFTEFQLAKYAKTSSNLKMVDAANLLRPKATPALNKLMKGKLAPAETWEVTLTQSGEEGSEVTKSEAWAGLLREGKLGYMALVRNIRNILTHAPECVDELCEQLVDEKAIRKSLMLPFRFMTAFDIVKGESLPGAQKVLRALSKAADLSTKNVPDLPNTLIALDVSGSMTGKPATIAALFAATLIRGNPDTELLLFESDARYKTVNADDSVLTLADSLRFNGGGTNFHSIFARAKKKYDRVVILSDLQGWIGHNAPTASFAEYRKRSTRTRTSTRSI